MKTCTPFISMILCFTLALLSVSPGFAAKRREVGVAFPMKYEGGSLPLAQHDKLTVYVGKDEMVLVQGKRRLAVPVKSINEVSYGNDVHRRVGAAIGVATMTLGIGLFMLLVKTKKHYVGVVWADKLTADMAGVAATVPAPANGKAPPDQNQARGGVVFKVGKGDYRGFMTALQGVTGIKATNADAPTGGGGTSKP